MTKMKKFSALRKTKLQGKTKSFKGIKITVAQEGGKYIAYVDGDRLDVYRNEREAFKAGEEFIKQVKT